MKQWMIFSFTEKGSEWNKTLLDWRISLGDSCKGYTVSRYAKKLRSGGTSSRLER